MISKPITFTERKHTFKERLTELVWPLVRFYRHCRRAFDWARFGWDNYDWDYSYIFKTLQFKLKRTKYAIDNGVALPDPLTNKSLRICIKLLTRINERDYSYFTDLHSAKWGETEWVWHRTDEDGKEIPNGCSRVEFKRPNAITPEQKEQEREEFRKAYEADEAQEARDKRLLFRIIDKYHKYWWD